MALTKKQVKQLRGLATKLNPLIQVGKNDLSENAIKQADETIEKRELIKCSVLDGSGLTAKEAGEGLAEELNAELVQVIGNRFVLYRLPSRRRGTYPPRARVKRETDATKHNRAGAF